MKKNIIIGASFLLCVIMTHGSEKKVAIKDGNDLNKILRAREEYKNNKRVGMVDVTRGNRINYDPTQSSDTRKNDAAKKEEI